MTKLRKGNVTILASIFVMALVASVVSVGTQAWFSAGPETTGPYVMNAGTMTMAIQTTPVTFSNLKPGDVFGPVDIVIRNTGSIDIWSLAGSMTLSGSGALADKIEITQWDEYLPGYGWQDNLADPQHFALLVQDGNRPLTLLEAAQSYSTGRGEPYAVSGPGHDKVDQWGKYKMYYSDFVTGAGYDQHSGYAIKTYSSTSQDYIMRFKFKFSETAGNGLQGASVSFTISFLGMQDYVSQRP
jgi:hypothetical protein